VYFYACKTDILRLAHLGGVSRAWRTAREFRKSDSIAIVSGCAPPSMRRAIRAVSSSVVTASRTSSSMALGSWIYAGALYEDHGATLDDVREAVTTLEETTRTARRVLGGAHPLVVQIEPCLRQARAELAGRETQPSGDS
jgi:hypothetical protein